MGDYKANGNEAFKNADWHTAIAQYSLGLKPSNELSAVDRAVLLKNRAAAHLKLANYEDVISDCTKCLEITVDDPKALFRRCQAFEALKRYDLAYQDAQLVLRNDPKNALIQPSLKRLHQIVQQELQEKTSTASKLERMLRTAFGPDTSDTNEACVIETALNNLVVLVRENHAAELALQSNILEKIHVFLKRTGLTAKLTVGCVRIMTQLCVNNEKRTKLVLCAFSTDLFLQLLYRRLEGVTTTLQYCLQTILNSLGGVRDDEKSGPDKDLCATNRDVISRLLLWLIGSLTDRVISGDSRDSLIELLIRNCHYKVFDWAPELLLNSCGVERLLECASELKEYRIESSMDTTPSTAYLASVCLARIYENMYYDAIKTQFCDKVEAFINAELLKPELEAKIRAVVALTALLRGPLDVGNTILGKAGILEMILVMGSGGDPLQQKVAIECLVAGASKSDKAASMIAQGVPIIKNLYKNGATDGIQVRALVGLCKLGSSGGTDASKHPFGEGATIKLSQSCRRYLYSTDVDQKKWATEGLSYLTLDGEVKDQLMGDERALRALLELPLIADKSCVFNVTTTLVNLTNSYDKGEEIMPEMLELAKFAKQHIPERSEFDGADFVTKRLNQLGRMQITSALVAMFDGTDSENVKELLSRIFNGLTGQQDLRGFIVQQGGTKVLLKLALNGTDKGKRQASQALARIAITINPEVAFAGQRALEIVRPLITLLHQDCTGLENFEALMALCNLAQMNESTRKRIFSEGGLGRIEHYMFEEHVMLKRAATQCLTNMCMLPSIGEIYGNQVANDRLKYVVALVLDDDFDTQMAAAGALAILTESNGDCCRAYFGSKNWSDSLKCLLANSGNPDLQIRGICIVRNLVQFSKETAEKIIETDLMELLMVLCGTDVMAEVRTIAEETLKSAESWGIIQKPTISTND